MGYEAIRYQEIRYERNERILTITLHRPDRMNAFTDRMCRELLDALDRADQDDDVRVVIFTGAGRAFCAGADLGGGGSTFDYEGSPDWGGTIEEHRDGGGLVSLRLYDLKKPVIAAINGPAVGVGITMTLPMDVRIASSSVKMGFVFSRRGIVPEACSSWFLPRVVGISRATEWVYSGRVFPAREAQEAGLVSRVVPPNELLSTARDLAREIAENTSSMSVALSRQLLWKMLGADHPMEAHRLDSRCMFWMGRSEDAREGIDSFLEKRKPRFRMKPSEMPEFYPWWSERRFK